MCIGQQSLKQKVFMTVNGHTSAARLLIGSQIILVRTGVGFGFCIFIVPPTSNFPSSCYLCLKSGPGLVGLFVFSVFLYHTLLSAVLAVELEKRRNISIVLVQPQS